MRINFNLKQMAEAERLAQVMVTLSVDKKRIRVYTKLRVRPNEWDKRQQRCMLQENIPLRRSREMQLINKRLERMEERISQMDCEKALKGLFLSVEDVRLAVKESLTLRMEDNSPINYLRFLVESYSNGINRRGLKGSESSRVAYRTALKRLERFCKDKNYHLTSFDDFDRVFFSHFSDYLYNYRYLRGGKWLKYSSITVVNTLKVMNNLLHRAYDNDVSHNLFFNKTHAACAISEKIYLNEEEIERIRNVAPKNNKEREVRDLFVIACYTALRISDLKQLGKADFHERALSLYQVKTHERVKIPILKEISELMASYRQRGFPTLQESKSNSIIKKLAERAGLVHMVQCRENRGGEVEVHQRRKCDLVSFHTARRSCITNLFKRGYPVNYIQTLSGHRSLQTLQRYIRASQEDMAQSFIELLEKHNAI